MTSPEMRVAVQEPCPMDWGGPPCVSREIGNRCDTCNRDGTRWVVTEQHIVQPPSEFPSELLLLGRDGNPYWAKTSYAAEDISTRGSRPLYVIEPGEPT